MQQHQFEYCIDLIKKRSGLVLNEDKKYLIESRLLPIAKNNGCTSVPDLIELVRKNPKENIILQITEAMTTNESLFFRDQKPFDYLRQSILSKHKQVTGKSSLRMWSAACSNGQEPYSISMCVAEEAEYLLGVQTEIIATDLAAKVVEKAKAGIYSPFEVQRGLTPELLQKYFTQDTAKNWRIKDSLKTRINFRTQNLLDDLSPLGKFDIVFCRNVLIYFDEAARGQIVEKISKVLNHGGYLFLGSTEIIVDKNKIYTPVDQCRGLYRLK